MAGRAIIAILFIVRKIVCEKGLYFLTRFLLLTKQRWRGLLWECYLLHHAQMVHESDVVITEEIERLLCDKALFLAALDELLVTLWHVQHGCFHHAGMLPVMFKLCGACSRKQRREMYNFMDCPHCFLLGSSADRGLFKLVQGAGTGLIQWLEGVDALTVQL